MAPLPLVEWSDEQREALRGNLRRADKYLSGAPDAPPLPAILGLLARHPGIGAPWLAFSATLLDAGVLDPRDRELLVLRVGWRMRSRYEWAQHVAMGQAAGLTEDEIEAVPAGPASPIFDERDGALLHAVDELLDEHAVGDETWQRLREHFDDAELLEVLFVVGSYACLAMVLNSVGLAPDAGPDLPDLPDVPH